MIHKNIYTNKAIIYYYWDNWSPNAYKNIRVPIILSIATLRAYNAYTPIYVLDCSNRLSNWKDLPQKLGFEVLHWKKSFHDYSKPWTEFLARMKDVNQFSHQIPASEIIYCDSDVFWLKDPLPFNQSPDLFSCDKFNNGFYYFDKTSNACQKFFELFNAYALIALNDKRIKKFLKRTSSTIALDEIITSHLFELKPYLTNRLKPEEHGLMSHFVKQRVNKKELKMLHCNGLFVKNKFYKNDANQEHSRGLCCLIFREFYEAIQKTLPQEDFELIFTTDEINYYLKKQIDLLGSNFQKQLNLLNLNPLDVHLNEILNNI